jgi:hypothetical protein
MFDPLVLYRFAVRTGNRQLAAALARSIRADPELSERADLELQHLPRGRARWSESGERVVRAVLDRIGSFLL